MVFLRSGEGAVTSSHRYASYKRTVESSVREAVHAVRRRRRPILDWPYLIEIPK